MAQSLLFFCGFVGIGVVDVSVGIDVVGIFVGFVVGIFGDIFLGIFVGVVGGVEACSYIHLHGKPKENKGFEGRKAIGIPPPAGRPRPPAQAKKCRKT